MRLNFRLRVVISLDELQFLIRIVGHAYLDWNYSIAHQHFPTPRWELPPCRDSLPVPRYLFRVFRLEHWGTPVAAAAILPSGPDPNKIVDLPDFACACACAAGEPNVQRPRSDRAANAQQSRSNRRCMKHVFCIEIHTDMHMHICMYGARKYSHIHTDMHCPEKCICVCICMYVVLSTLI